MSFPPVSRVISAGFGGEGEERGPRVGDRCPGPRALVDEEPGPRVPRPGRNPLLRRDGGLGLPWTRGRLGDRPVIGLPNPGGVPRPAVSHIQPVGPGGSPGGHLGEGRETRHTRATADGPRDGAVTRDGPGRGLAGTAVLPVVPGSGSRPRSDPSRPARPTLVPRAPIGLGGPVRRGGWSGKRAPRAPLESGPPLLGPVRGRKWRSGRIVPPRTRPHRCHNCGIMRNLPGASEVPARTILPERQNQVPPGLPAPAARSKGEQDKMTANTRAPRPRGPVTGSCPAAP